MRPRQIATIKLSSGCSCKAKSAISSNISSPFFFFFFFFNKTVIPLPSWGPEVNFFSFEGRKLRGEAATARRAFYFRFSGIIYFYQRAAGARVLCWI